MHRPASPALISARHDYRPDIDGLRAIAVLAVVLYHAFPGWLPGGFVGVDIFFVISGYLITKHILGDLSAGAFSIRTFYARRIRRIFPALLLVLLVCLLLGWLILTPGEYEKLGRHVFAGALFLANILSWREAGYFDTAADTKPLLHLWSLGIEEQFYIVWPLLLALAWRFRRGLAWVFPGVIVASLVYSLFLVQRDVVADFYSPVTRFWELALGAALAHPGARQFAQSPRMRQTLSYAGLLLILLALGAIDSSALFPGAWALLPTLGAALLIHAGIQGGVNRLLLSWRPMVWVGLISYPLYLWHWPLLSFARIIEAETPSLVFRSVLVAASVVLAWLTWRFVERPVRARPKSHRLIWILCLSMLILGVAGFVVKSAHGYRHRLAGMMNGDPTTMVVGEDRGRLLPGCGIPDAKKAHGLTYCMRSSLQAPRYAMLGDSKAEALFYGLVRESGPDLPWVFIGTVYPPQPGAPTQDRLDQRYRLAFQTIAEDRAVEVVVLAFALRTLFPIDPETGLMALGTPPRPGRLDAYSQAIRQFQQVGKRVVFVLDHPTFPDPTSCVSGGATRNEWLNQFLRRKENARCQLRYSDHQSGTRPYQEFAAELKRRHPELVLYDPAPLLCDAADDRCPMTRDGKFLYSYGDHLSDQANTLLARELVPALRKLGP